MENYFWIIYKDHIDNGKAVGVCEGNKDLMSSQSSIQFKMFDDDNILYYEGMLYGDFDGFEPLDGYGRPAAGCTSIQLYQNGKWETL
jgi:hypothetical protein